jgi:hypothetical protein
VARIVEQTLEALHLAYPSIDDEARAALARCRAALEGQ